MSIDLDFAQIWANASSIINSLWPVFSIPLGIVFGFGIIGKIISEIRSSLGRA